ncbi:hypothetical protein ABIA69_001683 [Lysinibacillus parviboronicapiens]|uniref:Lipoprotein n=1 Tax=Lysinibacillus parviboronicapiens TaxID=436516 RepID=A0ABV2PIS9_9BACI
MKSKWISVMFAALVLAGCGSDEAGKGEKKEQVAGQESAAKEKVDNNKANLAKIFAEGSYKADVMAIGLPADLNKKMEKITETMQTSLAQNEEWFSEVLAGLAEGEILPYHEKLGITEEEYKFLLEADQHFQLGKVGESDITITRADEQSTIQNPTASIVKELTISADGNTLTSNLGDLTYVEEIIASDEQIVTGRWNGHIYRMGGENTKQVLQISIGQLEDSKKKVIYTKLFEDGHEKKEEILMF